MKESIGSLASFATTYVVYWSAAARRAATYESQLSLWRFSAAIPAASGALASLALCGDETIPMAISLSGLAVCATTDLQAGLVFDAVMAIGAILLVGMVNPERWIATLLGSVCSGFLVFIPYAATRGRGIGFGDVKLAAFCGLSLGYPLGLAAVWCAFVIGGAFGVALLSTGRVGRGVPIPFAPFLAAGTLLALLWGRLA